MKKKKARATPWMPDCMTAVWPGSWTMLHLVCVTGRLPGYAETDYPVWTKVTLDQHQSCLFSVSNKKERRGKSCVCVVTLRTAAMTNTDWCVISASSLPLSSLSRSSRQAFAPAERLKTPLVYGPSRYRNASMSFGGTSKQKVTNLFSLITMSFDETGELNVRDYTSGSLGNRP